VLQFDTFLASLLILLVFHNSRPLGDVTLQDKLIQSFALQIDAVQPKIDPAWRVLFLDDPFAADDWTPLTWMRLYYRAPDLVVDRIKRMPNQDRNVINSYDCIFTFEEARLIRVKP
jgi:hypothetical protein